MREFYLLHYWQSLLGSIDLAISTYTNTTNKRFLNLRNENYLLQQMHTAPSIIDSISETK